MNKTSLEIALKYTEMFQKEYPKKDLHEITEALANEIEQAIQVQAKVKPEIADNIEKIVMELSRIQINLLFLLEPEHHENTCEVIHQVREYLINIEPKQFSV